jgi:hypothetical protein
MRMRSSYSFAQMVWTTFSLGLATEALAQNAPVALRGKSIVAAWTENRLQRGEGGGEFDRGRFPTPCKFIYLAKDARSSGGASAAPPGKASAAETRWEFALSGRFANCCRRYPRRRCVGCHDQLRLRLFKLQRARASWPRSWIKRQQGQCAGQRPADRVHPARRAAEAARSRTATFSRRNTLGYCGVGPPGFVCANGNPDRPLNGPASESGPSRHCEVGRFRTDTGLVPKAARSRMTHNGRRARRVWCDASFAGEVAIVTPFG